MSPRRLIAPEDHQVPVSAQVADLPMFAEPGRPDFTGISLEVVQAWYGWIATSEAEAVLEAARALAVAKVRGGADQLFIDEMLWELRQQTPRRSLNNTYRSCLARWLMWREPTLRGRFETRGRRKAS